MKRAKRRREEGQAIVEAAYVIPLLIVVLCGIIDFGWIFSNQLMVNNCSREGARYAAVHTGETGFVELVTQRVKKTAGIGSPEDLTVNVEIVDGDVQVTVSRTLRVLTPLAGVFTEDQTVTLTSKSVMRIE